MIVMRTSAIRAYLRATNTTMTELAKRVGVTRQTISYMLQSDDEHYKALRERITKVITYGNSKNLHNRKH